MQSEESVSGASAPGRDGGHGEVDFVLTWVDGADPAWRESRRRFLHEAGAEAKGGGGANAECRYRDFGTLRHWFRAVEACAPWVRRVFLVTAGQAPDWLDRSCPKLRLVDHRDFIPAEWLPTFNARPIELNLHRVADLAERFVLFNDDMFLLRPVGTRWSTARSTSPASSAAAPASGSPRCASAPPAPRRTCSASSPTARSR